MRLEIKAAIITRGGLWSKYCSLSGGVVSFREC